MKREAAGKQRIQELEELEREKTVRIAELTQQMEALKAKCAWLAQQLFGQKSERTPEPSVPTSEAQKPVSSSSASSATEDSQKKKRGQQPGSSGHGRQRHPDLPSVSVLHELPEEKRQCPQCHKPFALFPGTEDSEELHWEVHLVRRIHQRAKYRPTCQCGSVSVLVTAPAPPKLIPKGMFSIEFWAMILLEKFHFQRPLSRTLEALRLQGLSVSQGTLTGSLQRIALLLRPVYTAILEHSRAAGRRKMDETRWFVFEDVEGKQGHRWWMWIDVTVETCVYIPDPSRSAEVVLDHLGESWEGIIGCDCYSAYKAYRDLLVKAGKKVLLAFCWSHRRRDFVELANGYERLRPWAESWVADLNTLFQLNDQRVAERSNPEAFQKHDQTLRQAIAAMAGRWEQELADATLHPEQRKVLACLRRHWEGLTLFVEHPEIPMDNNEAERLLRNLAVGRKNYYGSGAIWSVHLAAYAFSIFQTLLLNRIHPWRWCVAYFTACAQNAGQPLKTIDAFLPWNLSEEQKAVWRYPLTDRPAAAGGEPSSSSP